MRAAAAVTMLLCVLPSVAGSFSCSSRSPANAPEGCNVCVDQHTVQVCDDSSDAHKSEMGCGGWTPTPYKLSCQDQAGNADYCVTTEGGGMCALTQTPIPQCESPTVRAPDGTGLACFENRIVSCVSGYPMGTGGAETGCSLTCIQGVLWGSCPDGGVVTGSSSGSGSSSGAGSGSGSGSSSGASNSSGNPGSSSSSGNSSGGSSDGGDDADLGDANEGGG